MQGFADERFAPVRAAFEQSLTGGAELGATVCITVDGETVVDLWGGHADAARSRPWERDTILNVYSVTKTMTALTALLLADRGELDIGAPVARYWPEFAAAGKADVTVAHLLSHSSGLSGWAEPVSVEDLYDWDRVTGLLAAQEPFWAPGTASGYHVVTQGFLVGEVLRRITGRSLGTLFREEVAVPLGVDFHIGLPESEEPRVAELVVPEGVGTAPAGDPTPLQANAARPDIGVRDTNTRAWRAAEIPAGNGTGNARAVATALAVLACGGEARGTRLMSGAGARRALEVQVSGTDLILPMPVAFGLGFAVGGAMPNPNTIYWGGLGGSIALADLDARTTFTYVPNRLGAPGDARGFGLLMAMWEAQKLI